MAMVAAGRFRAFAAVAAAGAVGVGLTVRHQAARLRANDIAQRATSSAEAATTRPGPPNLYVSVDRSGGGI